MKNVYDNGEKLIGTSKNLQKYLLNIMNNADYDTNDIRDMIDELKIYKDDTIVLIDYEAPMGFVIDYWSKDNAVKNLELNEEGEI